MADRIYLIAQINHYLDGDWRKSEDEYVHYEEEGFFLDHDQAEARAAELNASQIAAFERLRESRRNAYDRAVREQRARQREIDALRSAGIQPSIKPLPDPVDHSNDLTDWRRQDTYTEYVVLEVKPHEEGTTS